MPLENVTPDRFNLLQRIRYSILPAADDGKVSQ
jgi:hypothetical protein